VWRLYKLNELSVRKRRKAKRVNVERVPLVAGRHVNDTWSADFVMDALANGRRIKCLTVVDDFSRESVDIAIDYGMGGQYVTRVLDQVGQFRGPRPSVPIRGRSSPAVPSWPGHTRAASSI
jgi:putative transposase